MICSLHFRFELHQKNINYMTKSSFFLIRKKSLKSSLFKTSENKSKSNFNLLRCYTLYIFSHLVFRFTSVFSFKTSLNLYTVDLCWILLTKYISNHFLSITLTSTCYTKHFARMCLFVWIWKRFLTIENHFVFSFLF